MITTKWPRLLVVGQPITEEQADEILIRTSNLDFFSNDKAWERIVADELVEVGAPREPADGALSEERIRWYREFDAWKRSVGVLNLHYLGNSRIASAWIGGPHGWCDWSGVIGCNTYNIGKWPSTEEVDEDWAAIAAAFPYLDLTAQLLEEEGEGALCGQWRVKDGQVAYNDTPERRIVGAAELSEATVLSVIFMSAALRERGVSVERLRRALARVVRREDGEPDA